MGGTFLLIIVALVVLVFIFIGIYNGFIVLKNRVQGSWAQVDVQLKKRYDLVPNLVETVKGYAAHERGVFENVTKARTAAMGASGQADQMEAENMLSGALKTLFAVAEAYPDLKANQNFLALQTELANIEDKIAYARQHYNDVVLAFNTKRQRFPDVIVANIMALQPAPYFEVEEAERDAVKVSFGPPATPPTTPTTPLQ
jgi:LemA protein